MGIYLSAVCGWFENGNLAGLGEYNRQKKEAYLDLFYTTPMRQEEVGVVQFVQLHLEDLVSG